MIERKEYIDISKGIGIFFIILVHLTVYKSVLSQILLSFCVAIFFFYLAFFIRKEKISKIFFVIYLINYWYRFLFGGA